MKGIWFGFGVIISLLCGCSNDPLASVTVTSSEACIGSVDLSPLLASAFERTEDLALLNQALGEPGKGGVCQGQIYMAKADSQVKIYRAWNSTNPQSRLGLWWAFNKPAGLIAQYREDYQICYQWSPLDKLVSCTLKPGTKIVVGTGQSARCSDYLSYPVSGKQQVFIENAAENVVDCHDFSGMLSWQTNH